MFQTFETTGGPEHVAERVKALRALLPKAKLDAFLVPRADEFQGEYVPACAERLQMADGIFRFCRPCRRDPQGRRC